MMRAVVEVTQTSGWVDVTGRKTAVSDCQLPADQRTRAYEVADRASKSLGGHGHVSQPEFG
jgi:hypothetical protein